MDTHVEFKTDMFPELPGEAEENINGFLGKGVALWIRDQLPAHGQATDEDGIVAEDWGWLCCLECDFPLWIGCGRTAADDEPDGAVEYRAFVVAEPPFRIFRKIDTKPAVSKALVAFRSLIESEPRIRDVVWSKD